MNVIFDSKFFDSFQFGLHPIKMHTASIVYATICMHEGFARRGEVDAHEDIPPELVIARMLC